MRLILSGMVFGGLALGFGMSTMARADDLRDREEKRVLFAIDQVCADTWCEGDYNFQFRSFTCNFTLGSCVMKYRTSPWPSREGEKPRWSLDQTCVIRNVGALDQVIRVQGQRDELVDEVYEQITECVDYLSRKNRRFE